MTKNERFIERLEQLIRVMQSLSPHEKRKHFNMGSWGRDTECGTTCCAAGFAGLDPWFRKKGFTLERLLPDDPNFKGYVVKTKNGQEGWGAIWEFFGVHCDDASDDKIFSDPRSVAGVIKAAKARIKELRAE